MLRKFSIRRVVVSFLFDWLGTIALFILAAWLRINIGNLPQGLVNFYQRLQMPLGWTAPQSFEILDILSISVIVMVALIWPFYFLVFGVYEGKRNATLRHELLNIFLAVTTSMVFLAGLLYFTYRETPRLILPIFYLLDLGIISGSRILIYLYKNGFRKKKRNGHHNIVIVGAGPVGENVALELDKYAWANLQVVGFADDATEKQGERIAGYPVLGTLSDLEQVVANHHIHDAIISLPLRAHDRMLEVATLLQKINVRVFVVPDLFTLSFPNASLDGFGGIPLIDLGQPGLHGYRRFRKRTFDVIVVSIGLFILSPLLLLVSILIKLDSKGPIFFKQHRVGENGKLFTMLKFRSMCANADQNVHKDYVTRLIKENISLEGGCDEGKDSLKMVKDPRITRFGKFIRKTSLDELPQLLNVLVGDMSLVGPRPPLPYEVELYKDWHQKRFEALPGITGVWQVNGRNKVSFDEMVRMDIEYIKHQSFWLDLLILVKTPYVVLKGIGAG